MYCMAASLFGAEPMQYVPTLKSVGWFLSYHGLQVLSARWMPGVLVQTNGMDYQCNGYLTFWCSLLVAVAFHATGLFDLTTLVKEYPSFMSTAIILGDIYSVIIHVCFAKGKELTSIYDFFMGTALHPRLGKLVDVKMVAETRLSWTLLLLITLGCYVQTYRLQGSWLNPTGFMVLAHLLYGQACAKGEHFIPYTWDITTEKFGWMLCWWNLAGVPLLYCYQSLFLCTYSWDELVLPPFPGVYYAVISVCLVLMYALWDEANYQKCYFKAERRGQLIRRDLFPTFRHIENPKYIKCEEGVLLIDGWYAKARKMHYTADTAMALLWGMGCGFSSFLPYFYFSFFCAMITHRALRDEERCKRKYGATWEKYIKEVPYRFIPGVW
mmetsp:Transcript_36871/g.65592  ORF Transcript_36871/g.65592 Transcript_36871/m.65592 type:complete len:382 (-) Transcript_36871:56-1201(-)